MTEQDITSFAKKGFVKLKGFLSHEAIQLLDLKLDRDLEPPATIYAKGVNRLKYDLKDGEDLEIVQHPLFRSTLSSVCQKSLFYVQNVGFELKKNKGAGVLWHVGNVSFSYQHLENFGCSLWIPLTKIDTKSQGGGMIYVSKAIFSGKFLYQYTTMLSSYVQGLQEQNKTPSR
ncbi:hypothetical protein [Moorena sp. SIO3I6]|uniref:hypothetical protein n=1 Tax=Moorena sp. SIO3I6 TaxID=2607831 RepID=UPI0013F6DE53|nr:hypothetical protein [Moorena sp. SIO3I6]NEP28217.1 hypothetical protein [Moorena sp. SIO3I6]